MEKANMLKGKGEVDYDFKHDILFFKTAEREYRKSIELDGIVIDIDKEGFIVGIQIFDASEFLKVDKNMLRNIPNWGFTTIMDEGRIEIRLVFTVMIRNKLVEKNPIIIQNISEPLPNSVVECAA